MFFNVKIRFNNSTTIKKICRLLVDSRVKIGLFYSFWFSNISKRKSILFPFFDNRFMQDFATNGRNVSLIFLFVGQDNSPRPLIQNCLGLGGRKNAWENLKILAQVLAENRREKGPSLSACTRTYNISHSRKE